MKKGISTPMLAIALGIIFIVIVLLVFGVPLKDYVTKQFEVGPFKVVKPDTSYVTGTTGEEGGGTNECTDTLTLVGTANNQASQIAAIALSCYNEVEQWWYDYKACEPCVKPTVDIGRDVLFEEIRNKNHKWSSKVIEMITADWEFGYEGETPDSEGRKRWLWLAKDTPYLICADADWPSGDELLITGKMTCEGID